MKGYIVDIDGHAFNATYVLFVFLGGPYLLK
jgi:hypothetical protein